MGIPADSTRAKTALSLPIVHVADGAHPLVTVQGRAPTEHGSVPALWNVDPVTGDSRLLQEGDRNTAYWMLDASGEPRVWIERSTGETTPTVYARPKGTSDWTKLHIAEDLEVPLAYSDRDDAVYMLQRSDSGDQIKEVDLKTSTQTTVARAGKMESISLCLDEGREPTCIDRFDGTSHRKWIDPDFSQVSDQLDHAFGHLSYYFTSRDKNKCVYAIYTHGLEHPYAPYVYDCKTRALSPVGDEYPGLEIRRLGHVASLTYQTSDRSQIPAYLTLPPGTITSRPPLVVLLPPFGRYDSDIFDWRAQYMASLGYAVFQPQARGSSGFGYGFESAGFGQAGDKREQDIVDGVRHLAEKGMVDTTRVCVAGLETSGYTAMMALINHPDLFKCGFTIDGVSSPKMLLTEELAKFGDTQIDANFLTYLGFSKLGANGAVKSPLEGVGSLSRPLLIMASPNSTSIPYEQSVKIYKAALALKKNVNFVALPENSRNIGGAEARAATLTSIRDFLQANLSP